MGGPSTLLKPLLKLSGSGGVDGSRRWAWLLRWPTFALLLEMRLLPLMAALLLLLLLLAGWEPLRPPPPAGSTRPSPALAEPRWLSLAGP